VIAPTRQSSVTFEPSRLLLENLFGVGRKDSSQTSFMLKGS